MDQDYATKVTVSISDRHSDTVQYILWRNQNFRWSRMQAMSIVVLAGNGCKLFYMYGVRQTDTVTVQYLLSKGQTEF